MGQNRVMSFAMSSLQPKPMDIAEFLAWEEHQELRHEFDGCRAFAMTGGTGAHAAIQRNLLFSLTGRLRGKPCQPYGSELKIRLENSVRYPDAFVTCNPVAATATSVTEPVVIFEIQSKSTASEDIGPKRAEYQAAPTIARYIILQQTHRAAMVTWRTDDGWEYRFMSGDAAILEMPEIGINIPLGDIYEGIALEGDATA